MKRLTNKGLTVVELLVASLMCAIIASALSAAFAFAIRYEINAPAQREAFSKRILFEDRLRSLLETAYLSPTATDNTTYLIGTQGGQNPNGQPSFAASSTAGTTGTTGGATNTGTGSSNSSTSGTCDGIVFTSAGQKLPATYLQVTGVSLSGQGSTAGQSQAPQQQQSLPNGDPVVQDLDTLNTTYGPQGGIAEFSITKTAVGNPPDSSNALYLRTQRPADADYTQGGSEEVFDSNIGTIQFEFYDGLEWVNGWDTTQTGQRHLPSAVRVTYTTVADPNTQNTFVVHIPLSDLTPQNPLSNGSSSTTTPTAAAPRPGALNLGAPSPLALDGTLPMFTNLQIQPENQESADTASTIDPNTLLAPDPLAAATETERQEAQALGLYADGGPASSSSPDQLSAYLAPLDQLLASTDPSPPAEADKGPKGLGGEVPKGPLFLRSRGGEGVGGEVLETRQADPWPQNSLNSSVSPRKPGSPSMGGLMSTGFGTAAAKRGFLPVFPPSPQFVTSVVGAETVAHEAPLTEAASAKANSKRSTLKTSGATRKSGALRDDGLPFVGSAARSTIQAPPKVSRLSRPVPTPALPSPPKFQISTRVPRPTSPGPEGGAK